MKALHRILVTGFEPFGKERSNPTEKLAKTLNGKTMSGAEVAGVVLPVSFRSVSESLHVALEEHKPDVVIGTGLAPSSGVIIVERIGINIMNARNADNDGLQPQDEPLVEGGPAAYFSTLPARRIVADLARRGIPATLSYSAGTFLCNALLYLVLHSSATTGIPKMAGFLHVPHEAVEEVPKEVVAGERQSGMAFAVIQEAVLITVQESLEKLRG